MRMLVFFDLPTETAADRRHYASFRRLLIKNGFLMLQESVYCKLLMNAGAEKAVTETLRRFRPPEGLVQLLTVTEKQFASMVFLTGEHQTDVVDSDERMIVI